MPDLPPEWGMGFRSHAIKDSGRCRLGGSPRSFTTKPLQPNNSRRLACTSKLASEGRIDESVRLARSAYAPHDEAMDPSRIAIPTLVRIKAAAHLE
jgi:hypothetical protein